MAYKESAMARARRLARVRNREHLKRATASDITAEQELAMRKKTRKCPLCGEWMTNKPHLPNSKELDHILPINQGGTHTHGNVRIICRKCNQKRPKDGSDYTGPVTLWAQGPSPVKRSRKQRVRNVATCRAGLHPWVPENIKVVAGGGKRCLACYRAKLSRDRRRAGLRTCMCGASFPAGSTLMCPACTEAAAHRAAELHAAGGMTWNQIAAEVGYGSGQGIHDATVRIGYVPNRAMVKPKKVATCACGAAAWRQGRCQECIKAAAQRAVQLRRDGWTLRMIADEIGYSSITSVTNLIGTLVSVKPYSRSLT